MNGLLIVVALIFVICAIIGYVKGFTKIVASLAATLVTIALVVVLTPYVSSIVLKVVPIETMVQEKFMEVFMEESGTAAEVENSRDAQSLLIENAELPGMFKELLVENNNEEIYKSLGVTKFSEYVSGYLARMIANIISFLLTFIVTTVVIRIVIGVLGIIEKLPLIGGLNRYAGGAVGLGTGLVLVWVLMVLITLIYDTQIGQTCFAHIAENKFLEMLYNNNILMNYITKFRA